ncbi:hypothetical protein J6590_055598 [Homalodisca vitripennis]|nr:hypothetical protein J6590_055598 [Homalodisca vitripennis]
MPRRSRIPSNYQTRIRVRGQRHVFLGGWKLTPPTSANVAPPTSAKDRSSRIAQQTAADATNVAPRRLCQCDLSYLTTWLAIILKIHPQMYGRDATAV